MLTNDAQTPDATRLPAPDRTLSVSPLDLRQARFGTSMRGFDKTEVLNLLTEAADGYEQALRENERLRQEIARLEGSMQQHRALEASLQTTLVSAHKVADDMRDNAAQEAARIVREAEGKAELLSAKASSRLDELQRDIDGLKLKRREAETSLESLISALHNTLEFVREQDQRDNRAVPRKPRIELTAQTA